MQYFFFKKVLFEHENHIAVEKTKKKKFLGAILKILVKKIKKIYGNCMTSVFFFRKQK